MSFLSSWKTHASTFHTGVLTIIACISAISGYVIFIKPPLSAQPSTAPVSLEHHRIRSSASIPFLFKAMEGASIVPFPAFGPDARQLLDGSGETYGVLTSEFETIWENFPFREHTPANTVLWNEFSGSSHARDFGEIANAIVATDKGVVFQETAQRLICATEWSEINEDGNGRFSDDFSVAISGVPKDQLCQIMRYRPYNYYFTALTIENNSDSIVTDIWIDFQEFDLGFTQDMYYDSIASDGDQNLAERLSGYTYSPSNPEERSLSVSNLPPGRKILLLLNAYKPDDQGLPSSYFLSRMNIDQISYHADGVEFTINDIHPLAEQRLGLITTADGGVGGQ